MDDQSFERLFQENYLNACRYAYSLVGEVEAEDAVQEVFLRLYLKKEKLQEETFNAYLFRSLTNYCYKILRRRKRWKAIHHIFFFSKKSPRVMAENPLKAWESFSPLEKSVFFLMDYLDHTAESTQNILNLSSSTLRVVRHRIRKKIQAWEERYVHTI